MPNLLEINSEDETHLRRVAATIVGGVYSSCSGVKADVTRSDQLRNPGEYYGILYKSRNYFSLSRQVARDTHVVLVASSVAQARGRHM